MKQKLMFAMALLATLFVPSLVLATNYGEGVYGSCTYDETCTISLATSGTVTLPATTKPSGVVTIDKDIVTVTTNSGGGYTLRLESVSGTSSQLVNGGEVIPAVSASAASPATLGLNEWGYRIDGALGFGAGPTSAITSQPSSSLTFAGVPLLGAPQDIKVTASSAPSGDVTNVWYGVRADMTKPAGTYTSTVTYTAVLN